MAGGSGGTEEQKRALYWIGEQLIEKRGPVSLVVLLITAVFAWASFQLRLETSFSELLPQSHPYVETHNQYAPTFGGANNITIMLQVREKNLFNPETLSRIFKMTEAVDRVYGINHNQIDSIGHRTTRHLKVAGGGTMRSEPVMLGPVRDGDINTAAEIRRIVHNSQNIYGLLISLDDKAALVRGNYVEGRLDHRRTFEEVNRMVREPFGRGWFGALFEIPKADEEASPGAVLRDVFKETAAAAAGLEAGDRVMKVGDRAVQDWWDPSNILVEHHKVGETVQLTIQRGEATETVSLTVPEPNADLFIAGEPRLYGWVYSYVSDVFWILVITYFVEWILRWMYFHDWRGSLRPTMTGLIAAFWGFGFIHLIGLSLDPLMLVIPFIITARAVSHAIQMHDRYYEEYQKQNWDKKKAIVASFAELFIPSFSGIITDALGVLVIILVPVVMLQKLAVTASWWILAITVSEMFLNPIVYYYLKAPDPELVILREHGLFRRTIDKITDYTLSVPGRVVILGTWSTTVVVSAYLIQGLIIGDPSAASPLVWGNSPYNVAHTRIQEAFGGVEPLIVVNEGYDKDAMKDPKTLKSMEGFQRFLERDPEVGYSFSLVDILVAANSVMHELEPKWGVIPNNWVDVGGVFFIVFSSQPPTETARFVDPSYATSHVTFFCKNHKGDTIRRIIWRAENYIGRDYLERLGLAVSGPDDDHADGKVTVASVVEGSAAAKAGLATGQVIDFIGEFEIHNIPDLYDALRKAALDSPFMTIEIEGDSEAKNIEVPWTAAYRMAGGLIGVLAAGNDALRTNDLMMNFLAFSTVYIIMLFTYRSWLAGLYLLGPLFASNGFVNAMMSLYGIGITIQTLPVVTVGVGFGIDYGLYIVSRIIEEIQQPRWNGDLHACTKEALCTSGKAVTFTAITMIASTALWIFSDIRFNAEMGGLLAIWMGVSYTASQTLLPVLILVFPPKFITREIPEEFRKS